MIDIIGKSKWWFIISAAVLVPGILALLFWRLNLGLDFRGGSILELSVSQPTTPNQISQVIAELDLKELTVLRTRQGIVIKTQPIDQEKHNQIIEKIQTKVGETKELQFETVGPTVSKDLTRKAVWSIIIASLGIILYLAFAFRSVPRPISSWRFGVCAVAALIHDALVVIGVFAILGHFFNFQVDSLFITALLTIIGFSVHDTIVVYDRIRENLIKHPELTLTQNANNSISQTLARSINTSMTVIIVLTTLLLLGGQTIRHFTSALLVGIVTGTYSSIFVASALLVVWQNWRSKRDKSRLLNKN